MAGYGYNFYVCDWSINEKGGKGAVLNRVYGLTLFLTEYKKR